VGVDLDGGRAGREHRGAGLLRLLRRRETMQHDRASLARKFSGDRKTDALDRTGDKGAPAPQRRVAHFVFSFSRSRKSRLRTLP
jgi:hypothetical protein